MTAETTPTTACATLSAVVATEARAIALAKSAAGDTG